MAAPLGRHQAGHFDGSETEQALPLMCTADAAVADVAAAALVHELPHWAGFVHWLPAAATWAVRTACCFACDAAWLAAIDETATSAVIARIQPMRFMYFLLARKPDRGRKEWISFQPERIRSIARRAARAPEGIGATVRGEGGPRAAEE